MARIPSHIVDEIMNTARIEEVIGEFVQLKKSGSNFKALSPFTDEKTPSFMVSPAKQIFKCFSTGKGGTAVSFLMEYEQLSYPEALKWLAEKYNIQLPEEKPLTPEEQAELSERESLQVVNTFARDFFVETLTKNDEGKAIGLSYFKERGFREDTIEKFQLGFNPRQSKSLTQTALDKGYKLRFLEQLGLSRTKNGRSFDFFSGRVIFPIHSISGKVLGFGGRILDTSKKTAKYFNSPDSPLYDKSKILYGIYFAKNEILKHDNCYLVEGYTDVISLAQSGVENVVSSSGTSLTGGQIRLIQRYTSNITVLYDSDKAGIKASFRGIDMLLAEGMTVRVVSFPEGEDPDSFAKKVSSDELQSYLEEKKEDFVGFKTRVLLQDVEDDPIQRSKLIKTILESIALIPDEITRSVFLKDFTREFSIDEKIALNELNKIRLRKQKEEQRAAQTAQRTEDFMATPSRPQQLQDQEKEGKRTYVEQEFDLIRLLILYGSRAVEINEESDFPNEKVEIIEVSVAELVVHEMERDELKFNNPLYQEIYEIIKEALKENIFYEPSRFLRMEDQKIVQLVTDILSPAYELSGAWVEKFNIEVTEEIHQLSRAIKDSIYAFKSAVILQRIDKIQEQLKNEKELTTTEIGELLRRQIALEKIKSSFSIQLRRIII